MTTTTSTVKDYSDPKTCISAQPRSQEDLAGLIADVDLELAELEARRDELQIERQRYADEMAALAA